MCTLAVDVCTNWKRSNRIDRISIPLGGTSAILYSELASFVDFVDGMGDSVTDAKSTWDWKALSPYVIICNSTYKNRLWERKGWGCHAYVVIETPLRGWEVRNCCH